MKPIPLLTLVFGMLFCNLSFGSDEMCQRVLRAETYSQMNQEKLLAHRRTMMERTPGPVIEAICTSTRVLTLDGYHQQLAIAEREAGKADGADHDAAELYFFLECGEDQVNLSPLGYHAFNLNRDEYGFLGAVTLAITWMSVGYLDIKDPQHNRSFMDIIRRVLDYAREQDSPAEIEMYEDLLQEIEGYKEDHDLAVQECLN